MEKIKVNVERDGDAYFASTALGRLALVKFDKGFDVWYFNAYGIGKTWISAPGDVFPLDYFKRLCQAICLISLGLTEFPEIELTANAKKLLKIK